MFWPGSLSLLSTDHFLEEAVLSLVYKGHFQDNPERLQAQTKLVAVKEPSVKMGASPKLHLLCPVESSASEQTLYKMRLEDVKLQRHCENTCRSTGPWTEFYSFTVLCGAERRTEESQHALLAGN